jgi:metal-dependent amidase/aminoacylase/carboxypeptidase family protein
VRSLDLAKSIGPDLVALRRRLHERPELGLDLPLTQQAVLDALAELDLEVTTGRGLSSVVAVLRPGRTPRTGGRWCCCAVTWTPCRSPRASTCRTPPGTRG